MDDQIIAKSQITPPANLKLQNIDIKTEIDEILGVLLKQT